MSCHVSNVEFYALGESMRFFINGLVFWYASVLLENDSNFSITSFFVWYPLLSNPAYKQLFNTVNGNPVSITDFV
jgi:hypothetical protein